MLIVLFRVRKEENSFACKRILRPTNLGKSLLLGRFQVATAFCAVGGFSLIFSETINFKYGLLGDLILFYEY